ncbi:MAG: hypothetical protein IJH34_14510, partial [Romboutsia sp.]|nr:hypothetical protein [Romboutsia sp.]
MRKTLKSEILGLVDIKNSYVELKLSDLFIGNKKYMNISAKVKISPNKELEAAHSLEIFTVKLYLDDEVIFRENVQVDLAEETEKIFEKDIEMINSQSEDRMFKLEIDDIKNGKIDYTSVSELVSVEPVKDSKVYIKFDYYKRGLTHNFSFYSNTKSKI